MPGADSVAETPRAHNSCNTVGAKHLPLLPLGKLFSYGQSLLDDIDNAAVIKYAGGASSAALAVGLGAIARDRATSAYREEDKVTKAVYASASAGLALCAGVCAYAAGRAFSDETSLATPAGNEVAIAGVVLAGLVPILIEKGSAFISGRSWCKREEQSLNNLEAGRQHG